MIARFITIISLIVFMTLLALGSTLEAALLKSATVFFLLVIGFNTCRFLITVIQKETPTQETDPSTSQKSA